MLRLQIGAARLGYAETHHNSRNRFDPLWLRQAQLQASGFKVLSLA